MFAKTNPNDYFKKTLHLIQNGYSQKAKQSLKLAKFYGYSSNQIQIQRGLVFLQSFDLQKALECFQSVLYSIDPEPKACYYLAETYFLLGNRKSALKFFHKAFEESQELLIQCKSLLYIQKIQSFSTERIFELAGTKLNYLVHIEYSELEQKRINALLQSIRGQSKKAIELFEEILDQDSSASLEICKEFLETSLRFSAFQNISAWLTHKNKKWSKKIKKDKRIELLLAKFYYLTGEFQKSKEILLKLMPLIPNHSAISFNLGNVYFQLGKYNRSAQFYMRASRINSYMHQALFNLAVLYHKIGALNVAEEYYKKVRLMKPFFYWVHYNMGILFFHRKDYFQSLNCFMDADHMISQNGKNLTYREHTQHNFHVIRKLKLLSYQNEILDKKILTRVNVYLLIFTGALLLLYFFL